MIALMLVLVTAPIPRTEVEITKQLIAPQYGIAADHVEYRLWDGTRVDMLSDDVAWEVDWAHKWAEGLGQALYYASVTGRRPGLVLLIRDAESERRYVYRAQTVAVRHGIWLRTFAVPWR